MKLEDMPLGWKNSKRAMEISTALFTAPDGRSGLIVVMADDKDTAIACALYSFDEAIKLANDILDQCGVK